MGKIHHDIHRNRHVRYRGEHGESFISGGNQVNAGRNLAVFPLFHQRGNGTAPFLPLQPLSRIFVFILNILQ